MQITQKEVEFISTLVEWEVMLGILSFFLTKTLLPATNVGLAMSLIFLLKMMERGN